MANILDAILSGFKKKKDEEQLPVAPAPTPAPVVSTDIQPPKPVGLANTIANAWNNYWQPSAQGVRPRDVVRELPGATNQTFRDYLVQPTVRAFGSIGESINQAVGGSNGEVSPERMKEAIPNDALRTYLYGNEPVESMQNRQAKTDQELQKTFVNLGVDKEKAKQISPGIATGGVMLGTLLDATNLGNPLEAPIKEAGEAITKKVGGKIVKGVAEDLAKKEGERVIVKTAEELAPMLQRIAEDSRGTLDDALTALKDKGVEVAKDLVKKLKSGAVVEGDGFVLQSQPKALIANFDKQLPDVLKLPDIAKQGVEDATKQVIPPALTPTELPTEAVPKVEIPKPIEQVDQVRPDIGNGEIPKSTIGTDPIAPTTGLESLSPETRDILSKPAFDGLDDTAKSKLGEVIDDPAFKENLARIKGEPLSHDEVAQQAMQVQSYLGKLYTRDDSLALEAQLKNTTDRIAQISTQMEAGTISPDTERELADLFAKRKSFGSFLGRGLESMKMTGDADAVTGQKILTDIFARSDADASAVINEFNKIDKTNPEAVRAFYRQYVKPTFKEVIDEYRYVNLLSSPRTQIKNVMANAIDAIVTEPATQVARGLIDRALSTINPARPRQTYAREALDYYAGMVKAIPEALTEAGKALTGKASMTNLDIQHMPVGKYAGGAFENSKIPGAKFAGKVMGGFLEKGKYITQAMEAGDVLFRNLVEGGVKAGAEKRAERGGIQLGDNMIQAEATRRAKDVLLRTDIDPTNATGQGKIFTAIDQVIATMYQLREKEGIVGGVMSTALPFLKTTNNFLKRAASYLPGVGAVTVIGQSPEALKETAARQVVGGVALMATLWYGMRAGSEDRMTASAPQDPAARTAFFDSGRKEYALLLGNNWVEFKNLGVLGATMALGVRLQEEFQDERNMTDSQIKDVADAYLGMIPYFADMSFAKTLGDVFTAMEGDQYAFKNLLITPLRQLDPLVGAQTWLTKLIDPVYRKSADSDGSAISDILAPIGKNTPFISKNYDPYLNSLGQESKIQNPIINAISPAQIGTKDPFFEFLYQNKVLKGQVNQLKTDFKNGKIDLGQVYQGVNGIMETATSMAGGNRADAPNIAPGEGVDLSFKAPNKEKLKSDAVSKLDPAILDGLEARIPAIKQAMLQSIIGSGSGGAVKLTGKISGKVTAPPKLKAISMKLPKLKKSKGVALASKPKPLTPPPTLKELTA